MDITTEDLPIAKLVRLKNGDDIIAEVVELEESKNVTSLILINPLKALYVPSTSSGYLQIAFMPWVYPRICSEQQFTISMNEVLLCCDVSSYMNEYYWDSIDTYITEQKDKREKKEQEEPPVDENTLEEYINMIREGKVFH